MRYSLLLPLLLSAQPPAANQAKRVAALGQREPFWPATNAAVVVGISGYAPETGRAPSSSQKPTPWLPPCAPRATRSAVREAATVADPAGSTLFFSGHGSATSPRQNLLVTAGGTAEELAADGLSREKIRSKLQKSPARQKTLFIDVCRDEPGKSTATRTFADLQVSSGLRSLLSTQSGKKARKTTTRARTSSPTIGSGGMPVYSGAGPPGSTRWAVPLGTTTVWKVFGRGQAPAMGAHRERIWDAGK